MAIGAAAGTRDLSRWPGSPRRTHVFNAYRKSVEPSASIEENLLLLDAIESGDAERARIAMADHIEAVKLALIGRLSGTRR